MAAIMSDQFAGGSFVAMEHDRNSKEVVIFHTNRRIGFTLIGRFELTPKRLNDAIAHYDRCVAMELKSPSNVGTDK